MLKTIDNLNHWTKKMFEKLGWMVLATHENNIEKVNIYLKSINKLSDAIDEKIKVTKEIDRINDLKILKEQVVYLQFFANASLTNVGNFKF